MAGQPTAERTDRSATIRRTQKPRRSEEKPRACKQQERQAFVSGQTLIRQFAAYGKYISRSRQAQRYANALTVAKLEAIASPEARRLSKRHQKKITVQINPGASRPIESFLLQSTRRRDPWEVNVSRSTGHTALTYELGFRQMQLARLSRRIISYALRL